MTKIAIVIIAYLHYWIVVVAKNFCLGVWSDFPCVKVICCHRHPQRLEHIKRRIYKSGHLSALRKWGGKTSDYAKSGGGQELKIHGKYK